MPSNNQRNNELEFTPTFGTQQFYENKNMKQYKGINTKLCSISRLRSTDALLMKRTSKNDVVLRVHNK